MNPNSELLEWLLDNMHRIEVHTGSVYCDEANVPALSLRFVELNEGRDWSVKSNSRERLREKLHALRDADIKRRATQT